MHSPTFTAGRPRPTPIQAKVLTDDEARRVAVNIARFPALLGNRE